MALLGHSIGESFLMTFSAKLLVQNRNESQTETAWKSKLHENENMIWIFFF